MSFDRDKMLASLNLELSQSRAERYEPMVAVNGMCEGGELHMSASAAQALGKEFNSKPLEEAGIWAAQLYTWVMIKNGEIALCTDDEQSEEPWA